MFDQSIDARCIVVGTGSLYASEKGLRLAAFDFYEFLAGRAYGLQGIRLQHLGPVSLKQRVVGKHISRDEATVDRRDDANHIVGRKLVLERALIVIELAIHTLVLIHALEVAGRRRGVVGPGGFG